MNIDIRILAVFMIFTNLLQVIALLVLYRFNKTHEGLGWWLMGAAAWGLGSSLSYLADVPVFGKTVVLLNNSLMIAGLMLIFVGLLRFFSQREKRNELIAGWLVISLGIFYFTFITDNPFAVNLIFFAALTGLSMLIARSIHIYKAQAVAASAEFITLLFLVNAIFFGVFALILLFSGPDNMFASTSRLHITIDVETMIISTMWTFGLIILANHASAVESDEARERFEYIFKSNPDAVAVTRLSDGVIVDINDMFTTLSGFSRSEIIGQSSGNLRLWADPDDRIKLFTILKERGFCEDFNARFIKKDGTLLDGIISARFVSLKNEPHMVSVIRNVTESKRNDEQIQQLVQRLQLEKDYAQTSASLDNLTLLMNRGAFDEALSTEFYRLKRSGAPLSLIMLDVDHFKQFNDRYGHLEGDDCLRKVASAMKQVVRRKPDVVARYGGEEFAVILPETDQQGAVTMAEAILQAVADLAIPHQDSEHGGLLTVSMGLVSLSTVGLSAPEKVIELADGALYQAKKRGRNRFEIARPMKHLSGEKSELVNLVWRVSAESGNPVIDEQHKNLFGASNKLLSAVVESKSKEECIALIDELLSEVVNHFQAEEAILRQVGYPLTDEHNHLHTELVKKAVGLAERFKQDETMIGELFSFLAYDVIARHMFIEDRKYFPYIQHHEDENPNAGEVEASQPHLQEH